MELSFLIGLADLSLTNKSLATKVNVTSSSLLWVNVL